MPTEPERASTLDDVRWTSVSLAETMCRCRCRVTVWRGILNFRRGFVSFHWLFKPSLAFSCATATCSSQSVGTRVASNGDPTGVRKQNLQYYGRSIGIVERVLGHPEGAPAMPFQNHQNHCGFTGIIEHTRWAYDFHDCVFGNFIWV